MKSLLTAVGFMMALSAQAQTIHLVSGDDYLPYADRKAPEGGMATEIVKKAFAEVKMEAKVEWLPWARGYNDTKSGTFAATFPYFKGVEREKDMLYSDAMAKLIDRVFIKAGAKKFNFFSVAGFAGSTICLPIGWTQPTMLVDSIKSGAIKVQAPKDISTCVKLLESERADFFVTEENNGKASIAASGVPVGSVVLADAPALSENGLYLIASKTNPGSKDLIAAFNKGLDALRKNGSYDKIVKSHLK